LIQIIIYNEKIMLKERFNIDFILLMYFIIFIN